MQHLHGDQKEVDDLKKKLKDQKDFYEDVIRVKCDDKDKVEQQIEELKAKMQEQKEKLAMYKEELKHAHLERSEKKQLITSQKQAMDMKK